MIAVIDYGMGNLRSVAKALEKVSLDVKITRTRGDINDSDGLVLPGVGAFRDCMKNLDHYDLIDPIKQSIEKGKPFLGICLGLQVLFSVSEEFGLCEGLDVFQGRVVRFPDNMKDPGEATDEAPGLKIPHMGWNQITNKKSAAMLKDISEGSYFYFVHSYYVAPQDKEIVATTTDYGIEFTSSIVKDNVFASQFHPEKSQQVGLMLLRNFGEIVNGG